jgi:hypothetical protein
LGRNVLEMRRPGLRQFEGGFIKSVMHVVC